MTNTALIILAAGQSARLGQPKQLLRFGDKTLLQHTIDEALQAGVSPVMVVTGARAQEIAGSIDSDSVVIVFNTQWEQGKGTGIAAGVRKIVKDYPEVTQVILSVCDQPYVSSALFQALCQTQLESGKNIVASSYAGTTGTPVLLTRKYFDSLLGLTKEAGAKQILLAHPDDVATVDFPGGVVDIDTMEDYEGLVGRFFKIIG
ncbi:MAG TPA: nucleotidyltransferase family protein [Saprospiraceae bacterium]|nr:nucleotidyltransferase family protein [Saprospiraceae bacterium]